ncbi:MAG: hypothetical protein C0618_11030, partial [Desulfuromonas sp.]
MSRLYDDGGSFQYDAANGKLISVQFGQKSGGAEFDGKPGGLNQVGENAYGDALTGTRAASMYVPYDYAATAAKVAAADYTNDTWSDPVGLFKARVDNTVIGNMRDCGECHVGGGGMEYFPRNQDWDKADNTTTGTAGPTPQDIYINGTGVVEKVGYSYAYTTDPTLGVDGLQDVDAYGNPIFLDDSPRVAYRGTAQDASEYTSFNYFIDIFDDDGDGDYNEPLFSDFAKTGVVEMDCLSCHMEGYSWNAAKAAKRDGRFDASRVAGAGMGTTVDTLGWTNNVMDDGFGTTADYTDGLASGIVFDDAGTLKANLFGKVKAVPPTENCATCHQGKYQVDWKKRGEMAADVDVHEVIGCMGCHERTDYLRGVNPNTDARDTRKVLGETVGSSLNIRDGKLGHDPAKGGAGQWDSLNNKNDWKGFKGCEGCHDGSGLGDRGKSYGAPNPSAAHAAAGLSATIVQKKGTRTGVADGSHLDIISCEACHITKASEVPHTMTDHDGNTVNLTYATGGAFVDGSAPDHEGRLATHDTYEVSRPMYTDAGGSNFGYTWAKDGKIHGGNMLTSLFWRDKNDVTYDVNVDGRAHGMDAVLPTHVLKNALTNTPDAGHPAAYGLLADGVSTGVEVADHITDLKATLDTMTGITGKTQKLKLSWVTVAFTMSHQIEPAAEAFGAGGCTDCHGSDAFYGGTIDMEGYGQFGFNADQTTPMTKVQGGTEKTFGHPNMKDKFGFISIPLMNNNGTDVTNGAGAVPADSTNVIRDMDRSEGLYEVTFRSRVTDWFDTINGSTMTGTSMLPSSGEGTTWKGWLLKLEVCDTDADATCATYAKRSMMIGPSSGSAYKNIDDTPSIAELLDVMPANFKNGTFGFTVEDNGNGGINITTDATHKVRVSPQSNYGAFKIPSYVL